MTDRIILFDTTLRDGEQSAGVNFSADDKLAIAGQLAAMGVDVIEAGFPAASAGEMRAVAAVAREIRGASICGLARAVEADIDAAAEALRLAEHPRIHVFINASAIQLSQQLRKQGDEVLAQTEAMVRMARSRAAEVEFSPMDATRADPVFLAALVRVAISAGASTINLPDTVGCARPSQVAQMFTRLRADVPESEAVTLSFHGQDDLGLATANALAAIDAGARQVELAVNGIGERAGNTAFEEVAMALRLHGPAMGVTCQLDTTGIHRLSRVVEEASGLRVPDNKAIVGRNAFRHASGIHQDGVIKHRATYEAIDPAWVGHPVGSEIVLGKLSGRAGFLSRARALGFDLVGARAEVAFAAFQDLADRLPVVGDQAVRDICQATA